MTAQHYEIILSRKHARLSLPGLTIRELSRLCECHTSVVRRMIVTGLIEPLTSGEDPVFDRSSIVRARKALRLKRDLHLNFDAVALVMELLDRIDELERKM
jgi:chaperone modulatory protein CbpM